jgi:hypothetical protein
MLLARPGLNADAAAPVLSGAGVWLAALALGHLMAVRWSTRRCPPGAAAVAGIAAPALLLAVALLMGARLTATLGAAGFVAASTAFAVVAGAGATQLAADRPRPRRRTHHETAAVAR